MCVLTLRRIKKLTSAMFRLSTEIEPRDKVWYELPRVRWRNFEFEFTGEIPICTLNATSLDTAYCCKIIETPGNGGLSCCGVQTRCCDPFDGSRVQ
ncbi:hypothetical protein SAMN05421858_4693 [Haladaptatus litoreus]|uniref:Uncharacterized protein n=1 Tax=Haladaptatus litoreus TaxID=553468 RepID=A0A1N7F0N7_9EURY|nr:hypothetical protein SAMN05421858_4693 [Haladaptatus litoreus]